jgi:hypothetical protein
MDDSPRFFNFLRIGAEKDERRLKKIEPAKDMTGASEAQFNLQLSCRRMAIYAKSSEFCRR